MLLVLAATMPVAAAHARPRAVAVVTMTSLLVATGLGYPTGVAALAALIALGVAAAIVDRRTALALAAAVSVLAVLLTSPGHHPPGSVVSNVAIVALVVLLGIVELSSTALTQTRETVGLMRASDDPADLTPLPTLDDLDPLITGLRASGVRIELHDQDTRNGVPAQVQSAAYRIIQEALSNIIKHAGSAPARRRRRVPAQSRSPRHDPLPPLEAIQH